VRVRAILASDTGAMHHDAIVKAFKAGRLFTHTRLNGLRRGQVLKSNLKREAHSHLASSILQ
jgi:hypothetical protein